MKNETERRWAERVAEWRASGLTSTEFSAGREFTAGGLRHWAYRLRKGGTSTALARRPAVRVLRVERVLDPVLPSSAPAAAAGLSIEVGPARVAVPVGFDGSTLRSVLELLVALVARRA